MTISIRKYLFVILTHCRLVSYLDSLWGQGQSAFFSEPSCFPFPHVFPS